MKEVIFEVSLNTDGSQYTATGFACPITSQAPSLSALREQICDEVRRHYHSLSAETILVRLHMVHREELTICVPELAAEAETEA